MGGKHYKLSELATVEKGQMPQQIAKENQQYRLCLQYEYIGSYEQGNKIQKRDLEEFNKLLPMGYTAESDSQSWSWGKKDNKQYLLLLVVIAIIFFTTSILFNSLKQPLAYYLCYSGILYRSVPYILLVPLEFRPGRLCFVCAALWYYGKCQHLYSE